MIKLFAALLLSLLASPAIAESAYLILDASVEPDSATQPKWITLSRIGGRKLNVRAGGLVHRLKPGKYRITNVVVSLTDRTSAAAFKTDSLNEIVFELEAGKIYYLVNILLTTLDPTSRLGAYRMSVKSDSALLTQACDREPKLMAELSLSFVLGEKAGKQFRYDCDAT